MNSSLDPRCLLVLLVLTLARPVAAQVPERLLIQGSVYLDGKPFHGAGQAKIALVAGGSGESHWSNDGTSRGGSEPQRSVPVDVIGGRFELVLGEPSTSGMLAVGSDILLRTNLLVRVWFSDGVHAFQHLAPDEALQPVAYAHVAARVPAGSIGTAELANGSVVAAKLAPRSVGPEHLADGAVAASLGAAGGLVVSASAEDPALIRSGLTPVGSARINAEAWLRRDFSVAPPRQWHAAFWTGDEMIVVGAPLSMAEGGVALAGYRLNPRTGLVRGLPTAQAPVAFLFPSQGISGIGADYCVAWSGTELLAWSLTQRQGRRCLPSGAAWTAMQVEGGPAARSGASAVWSGKEWLIWGGLAGSGDRVLRDGARYRPESNTWVPMSSEGAPSGRYRHAAVWAGQRMLVAGGMGLNNSLGGVWAYEPETDRWTRLGTDAAPTLAAGAFTRGAVIGNELLLFGGSFGSGSVTYDAGASFDLLTGRWKAINVVDAPLRLQSPSLLSTGRELVFWGGYYPPLADTESSTYESRGHIYDPATGRWREVAMANAPTGRQGHSVVWTGKEMVVWGGGFLSTRGPAMADGGRYRWEDDRWFPIPENPMSRAGASVAWTGTQLLVWGGTNAGSAYSSSTGARYDFAFGVWSPMSSFNAPTSRAGHSAVWTGREWLIWGGHDQDTRRFFPPVSGLATGARYDPSVDQWSGISLDGAPSSRTRHSSVWTGREMIVWGGRERLNAGAVLNSGARYDPASNRWRPMSSRLRTGTAVEPRFGHRAVWTGREMVVWGAARNPAVRGLRYDPETDSWSLLAVEGGPTQALEDVPLLWTGLEVVTFGSGRWWRYRPDTDTWRSTSPVSAPVWNADTATVWDGNSLVVWGGRSGASHRYQPGTDRWFQVSRVDAPPSFRTGHALVPTDDSVLLFGGYDPRFAISESLTQSLWQLSNSKPVYLYARP